ncbi:hypothetical protein MSAN_02026100 [Mycena sanguinolenta]|uniref:Uncharacterized protein n=1 Tax=Mycena sanguinolenta TaxID=230812 RepID=A0A8H6XK45_9AGAR|nr:hypothetical protein MSAN_02026100 [Mycena sanguinolenta]
MILHELRQYNLHPVLGAHVELLILQKKPRHHLHLQPLRSGAGAGANHNRHHHRPRILVMWLNLHWLTPSVLEMGLKQRHGLVMCSTMTKMQLLPALILTFIFMTTTVMTGNIFRNPPHPH